MGTRYRGDQGGNAANLKSGENTFPASTEECTVTLSCASETWSVAGAWTPEWECSQVGLGMYLSGSCTAPLSRLSLCSLRQCQYWWNLRPCSVLPAVWETAKGHGYVCMAGGDKSFYPTSFFSRPSF